MDDKVERLRAAAWAGDVVTIITDGGGPAAITLEVSPIHVGQRRLTARDADSGRLCSFALQRIDLLPPPAPAPSAQGPAARHSPLVAACAGGLGALEALGWEVELRPASLALFRPQPAASGRAPAAAGILEYATAAAAPYHVFGPGLGHVHTFTDLAAAVRLLAHEAVEYAPRCAAAAGGGD